jgi:hypothetical protein
MSSTRYASKALAAQGLAPPIGYLHSDKKSRNSLVWDAIEPLRPAIDAKVFAFVEAHEYARRDFLQSGYNLHRLSSEVTQLLYVAAVARDRTGGGLDSEDDCEMREGSTGEGGRRREEEGRSANRAPWSGH